MKNSTWALMVKDNQRSLEVAAKIRDILKRDAKRGEEVDISIADLVVVIGGDGTFLDAVRANGFKDETLFLGIHTGHLGFYCDGTLDDVPDIEDILFQNKYDIYRLPLLQVNVIDEDGSRHFYILNELQIKTSTIGNIILDISIDNELFQTLRGDGVLVASPTGSTAYAKSAGGAVVPPELEAMQVTELVSANNYAYRTLHSSFLLPKGTAVTIDYKDKWHEFEPIIGVDRLRITTKKFKQAEVTLAGKYIQTIRLHGNSYWQRVKRSFVEEKRRY